MKRRLIRAWVQGTLFGALLFTASWRSVAEDKSPAAEEVHSVPRSDRPSALVINRFGTVLVRDSDHGTAVFDLQTGRRLALHRGGYVTGFKLQADGTRILLFGLGDPCRMWDWKHDTIQDLSLPKPRHSNWDVSDDLRLMAVQVSDRVVEVRETGNGTVLKKLGHLEGIRQIYFAPNGRLLAIAGFDMETAGYDVEIWDWENERLAGRLAKKTPANALSNIVFGQHGSTVALVLQSVTFQQSRPRNIDDLFPGTHIWTVDGRFINEIRPGSDMRIVALSPDGSQLAAGSSKGMSVYDVKSGQAILEIDVGWDHVIRNVCILQDNKTLAIAVDTGFVGFWDIPTRKLTKTLDTFRLTPMPAGLSFPGSQALPDNWYERRYGEVDKGKGPK